MTVFERRGHRDQKGLRRLGRERGAQRAMTHGRVHQPIQLSLNDMDASGVDGLDGMRRHIDTDDLLPARRKQRGGGQADLAEADHEQCG